MVLCLIGEKRAVKGTVDKETERKLTGRKEVKDKIPRETSTAYLETTTKMTKKYQTKGKDSHGHIQWKSLQSTGHEDHNFLLLTQDSFLSQHVLSSQQEFVDNMSGLGSHWGVAIIIRYYLPST